MQETRNAGTEHQPLFATDQTERFTNRWQEIQTSFVDQPRDAVAEADSLVADLMQRLAASFSQERERLEAQWDRGDDVSTEDLRVALIRSASLPLDRLLSVAHVANGCGGARLPRTQRGASQRSMLAGGSYASRVISKTGACEIAYAPDACLSFLP